ncbi:MAG: GDSL-type esterase/lipase family protein [bacterium]
MSRRHRARLALLQVLVLSLLLTACQQGGRRAEVPRRGVGAVDARRTGAPAPGVRSRPRPRPAAVKGVPESVSWWKQRHAQKVRRVRQGEVDLLWIGDSIIHFWENDGKKVWDRYYARRRAVNLGFAGDRVQNVLWRMRHGELTGISPKVAVVMIGTNDAGDGARPARTAAHIRALVTELRTRLPRTRILLLAIFPCGEDNQDEQRKTNAAVNRLIAKLHDGRRVHFLDLGRHFLSKQGVLDMSVMPDLLHPGAKGYLLWARAMEPTLKRLLGER